MLCTKNMFKTVQQAYSLTQNGRKHVPLKYPKSIYSMGRNEKDL